MGTDNREYTEEFKIKAIELADEIGSKAAAEKLGLKNAAVIGAWKRWAAKNSSENGRVAKPSYSDLEGKVKELEKQLRHEKKVTEILKDATAFFSQSRLK